MIWYHPYVESKKIIQTYLHNRNGLTDIENKLVVAKGDSESHSVVSNSWQTDGLQPTRLPCPWNSPGQDTGVGNCPLLQGIFPTQGSNPDLPYCRQILYPLSHQPNTIFPFWVTAHLADTLENSLMILEIEPNEDCPEYNPLASQRWSLNLALWTWFFPETILMCAGGSRKAIQSFFDIYWVPAGWPTLF